MADELAGAIAAVLDARGVHDGADQPYVAGLNLVRVHSCVPPRHMSYRPSLCVIAQGAKEVLIGDRTITYGDMQSLVVTIDVPVLATISEGSAERPYLAATLGLDADIILDVATRLGPSAPSTAGADFGLVVRDMDAQITSAMLRLVDCSVRPDAAEILAPGILREIAYWLLTGPAGRSVARMVVPEGPPQRIARVIHRLRESFETQLSVGEMADAAGMSPSSFHQHFKALTSMSPLQYQKHLRLLEARRRMLAEGDPAGVAAHSVGYESASQFSREYARMFGAPPGRETRRARLERSGRPDLEPTSLAA